MNTVMVGFIGMWETVAILAVVLVLFGAKKVPELARGLGQGIKEFKKATQEVNDDLHRIMEEEPPAPARRVESSNTETAKPASRAPSAPTEG